MELKKILQKKNREMIKKGLTTSKISDKETAEKDSCASPTRLD